jgi:hypothetical protein
MTNFTTGAQPDLLDDVAGGRRSPIVVTRATGADDNAGGQYQCGGDLLGIPDGPHAVLARPIKARGATRGTSALLHRMRADRSDPSWSAMNVELSNGSSIR